MPLYDFRCAAGHTSERRAGYDQPAIACPECGDEARRVPVNRFGFAGFATVPMGERTFRKNEALNRLDEMRTAASKAGEPVPDVLAAAKAQAAWRKKNQPELVTGT